MKSRSPTVAHEASLGIAVRELHDLIAGLVAEHGDRTTTRVSPAG